MPVGSEWIIDAAGCDPALLAEVAALRRVCDRVIAEVGLHTVGNPLWQKFPGAGGVTGMYLLTESHLTCHTFPEIGAATFNLYCCRPRPDWPWRDRLVELLGADDVRVRVLERGNSAHEAALPTTRGKA